MEAISTDFIEEIVQRIDKRLQQINERLERIEDLLVLHFAPFPPCLGEGIDFSSKPLGIYPGPLQEGRIIVEDDDHVSGLPPTPIRIEQRHGHIALHCGYLLTITIKEGCQSAELLYFDGGGTIDTFDESGKPISSIHVPNSELPQSVPLSGGSSLIERIEIRSANEMFLLQVCCD